MRHPATPTDKSIAIGDPYQGGVAAHPGGSGQHGLIAAVADQSTGVRWHKGEYPAPQSAHNNSGL